LSFLVDMRERCGELPLPCSLSEIERDEEWLIGNGVDFAQAIVTIVPGMGTILGRSAVMDSPSKGVYCRCYFTKNDHIVAYEGDIL